MRKRHEPLPAPTTMLTHVVLHARVAADESVLAAQPVKHPLGAVALLARLWSEGRRADEGTRRRPQRGHAPGAERRAGRVRRSGRRFRTRYSGTDPLAVKGAARSSARSGHRGAGERPAKAGALAFARRPAPPDRSWPIGAGAPGRGANGPSETHRGRHDRRSYGGSRRLTRGSRARCSADRRSTAC